MQGTRKQIWHRTGQIRNAFSLFKWGVSTGKKMENLKVVFNGVGAAGTACQILRIQPHLDECFALLGTWFLTSDAGE